MPDRDALLESTAMNETDQGANLARAWLTSLLAPNGTPVTTLALRGDSAQIRTMALATLATEALVRNRTLLVVTADDTTLPELSNALDLNLRPLCLVLPAADYACRIALRATLSLLKSRLARAGDDAEGPAWSAQRQRLETSTALWGQALGWSKRGLDSEPWPKELERLFPVRILPLTLARGLSVASEWVVIIAAAHLPDEGRGPWPGATRTLFLDEPVGGPAGALVRADPANRQRAELDVLTQELSELELELATAHAEIADFTRRYHSMIGTRMSTLDILQAELKTRQAAAHPEDHEAERAAQAAQARAGQSQREHQRFADLERDAPPAFAPSGDIKKLYRKLAQKIHPDRARNDDDRAWRTQLMAEANRAYRAGDEVALQEVMSLWQEGAWRETLAEVAVDSSGLTSQLSRLKRRIAEIEGDLNRLFGSKLYELFTATNIARRAGRDLLREMALRLDADIAVVRTELAAMDSPSAV